jgi:serine/threonine protein kinase
MDSPKSKGGLKLQKINIADYECGITLGTGSFGRVKIAKHHKTGNYVAMKILKKIEIIRAKQNDHIINEISILNSISHPFIINFNGVTQDEKYMYLALEFINGGELFTYLRGIGKLDVEQTILYSAQICSIFEYLHSKDICYRDLKPENVLIDNTGHLKLTDFGFAKKLDPSIDGGRTYTLCGTPEYLAPEMLLNKGHGKPIDWWTLGIITYEMLVGIDPFSDDDPMLVSQKILKGKIKFPTGFDSNAKSLIKHLVEGDITKRYGNLKAGPEDVKNHKFFKTIDWTKLKSRGLTMPYIPKVKNAADTSNFSAYPDSDQKVKSLKKTEDPFIDWF